MGAICGADASLSTIWRTLKRTGYRMKKVSSILHLTRKLKTSRTILLYVSISRSLVMLLSAVCKSEPSTLTRSAQNIRLVNLFFLMRVLLTGGQLTVVLHGQLVDAELKERYFLFAARGQLHLEFQLHY